MKYLLNKTDVNGKRFEGVETVKVSTGMADFYGGNVNYFGRTKEGFLLCFYKNNEKIMDIYIDEDILTDEGRALLEGKTMEPEQTMQEAEEVDFVKMKRPELLALAKKLEIEGKIATMKSAELIAAIQEKRGTE